MRGASSAQPLERWEPPETQARSEAEPGAVESMLRAREAVYSLLARVFREEPSAGLLAALAQQAELLTRLDPSGELAAFLGQLDPQGPDLKAFEQELSAEYARLFLGGTRAGVFPYESVYTSPEGLVMQEARDAVAQEYRRHGLVLSAGFKEPEDHVAAELEFMAHLCRKAAESVRAGDVGAAAQHVASQQRFMEVHLTAWVPRFCRDLAERARSGFYRGFARLTREFLDAERELVPLLVSLLASPNGSSASQGVNPYTQRT